MTRRRLWTPDEIEFLRLAYPIENTAQIANTLGRRVSQVHQKAASLGVAKSREVIAAEARANVLKPGHGSHRTRIQPGDVSWNKGIKGSTGLHANSKAHHFKVGQLSGNAAQRAAPLGSYRVTGDGVLERKFSEQSGASGRRWVPVHREVWVLANGPVPAGHVVAFKPGHKTTVLELITLDAIELITRAENMRRNGVHAKYPPEVARLVQLRGALSRQINRKTKATEGQAI